MTEGASDPSEALTRSSTERLGPIPLASNDPHRPEPAAWSLGDLIAERYTLTRRLGAGAMGEVFLAHDRLLKKDVALKVLRSALAQNRDTVRRFLREVALAHTITHPHVVRIYDTGEARGRPYFSMEHLIGQPLDELIRAEAKLRMDEIASIGADVLDGLDAAHRAGVVHRDLKPANVILTHRGAIVMDFGVAGLDFETTDTASDPKAVRSLIRTEAGTIFGSPAYMAPELWEHTPATVQSDLYSFGVMLFQMLTGKLPYEGTTPAAYLENVRTHPVPAVRPLRRDAPWNLALLVRRCMDLDPMRRPPSARAAKTLLAPFGRRGLGVAVAALATVTLTCTLAWLTSTTPAWQELGLSDEVTAADLYAGIRSYDTGDLASARKHLDRAGRSAPHSASVAFWRANLFHELGDEAARHQACTVETREGSATWQELAQSACGPTFGLALPLLMTLDGSNRAVDPRLLPLAVTSSLIPRLDALSQAGGLAYHDAKRLVSTLEREPAWTVDLGLPCRWRNARVDLLAALGHAQEALSLARRLADLAPDVPLHVDARDRLELLVDGQGPRDPVANPHASMRALLLRGQLEAAGLALDTEREADRRDALRALWCGYAFRFELSALPDRCKELSPGLARTLWLGRPDDAREPSTMTPVELAILARQRDIDRGECRSPEAAYVRITRAAPPFETYLSQLDLTSALCAARNANDLGPALALADALLEQTPRDPWSLLLVAQLDERRGLATAAAEKRAAVARLWSEADGALPLVQKLRARLGPDPASSPEDRGVPR